MQSNTKYTIQIGKRTLVFESVSSTNELLWSKITNSEPLEEGTAILAKHQESGKGQRGNSWQAEKGLNLTFSYLLYPNFLAPSKQFLLSACTSIGIARFLEKFLDEVHIKWPNDLLIKGKKVCGILIESRISKNNLSKAVIGIGLNTNQTEFPKELPNATSLRMALNKQEPFDNEKLYSELCQELSSSFQLLIDNKHDIILQQYNKRLFQIHEKRPYIINNSKVTAALQPVGIDGLASLKLENKTLRLQPQGFRYIF